jgi:hypothetical protein
VVGVIDGAHCLIAHCAGDYVIQLTGICPYQTQRARGIVFAMPYAERCSLDFTVPMVDVEIVAIPCMDAMVSEGGAAASRIVCDIPPTTELSIQWSERIDEDEPAVVQQTNATTKDEVTIEKETLVSCEQQLIHSIGEGTVVRVWLACVHGGGQWRASNTVLAVLWCAVDDGRVSVLDRARFAVSV